MDDMAGDDWTHDDDDFDYNKRLQSDDEDTVEPEPTRTDPNWADQVEKAQVSQPYNFYEEMKKPAGFGMEEEEKRRTKKSEEVMKNLERARQRREEEENRYRRPGSEEFYKEDRSSRRFDEAAKENKTPTASDRKEWGYAEEKRNKPPARQFDERRENRFDERQQPTTQGDRFEQQQRGYYPQRFDRKEERSRKDELRKFDDSHFEDDYSKPSTYHHGRKDPVRSFDDRERNRSAEDQAAAPFTDFTNTEDSRCVFNFRVRLFAWFVKK